MSSDDIVIRVANLSKRYEIYESPRDRLKQFLLPRLQRLAGLPSGQYFREFWALKDVNIEVKRGETVGIIGRNGSGKSTLLQIICGTLTPTIGHVETLGRVAALLELGSGFNPEFTGRENVYMNAAVLGFRKEEVDSRLGAIESFADIGQFIDQPLATYSSGMVMRLGFSVAVHIEPAILVVDEALAVGDAAFQRKCLRKIEELNDRGVSLLFVSHDLETVRKLCTRVVYLEQGEVRLLGPSKTVCIEYERRLFGASKENQGSHDINMSRECLDLALTDSSLTNVAEDIYGDGRINIFDVRLMTRNGEPTNILHPKTSFSISYRVQFNEYVSMPIFGIMITNREGICIFGVNTHEKDISMNTYHKADEVAVSFHLVNNLGPGIYYLTCGVHAHDSSTGIVYLQRRIDTLIFRCISYEKTNTSGTTNMYPSIEYTILFKNNQRIISSCS
uniref:ABC transporter ATP-binding protein n=1 Tax=Desulfatirhabdium butyrativorans TaxID=340467 RepID=A0A7C4VRD8_9BACT